MPNILSASNKVKRKNRKINTDEHNKIPANRSVQSEPVNPLARSDAQDLSQSHLQTHKNSLHIHTHTLFHSSHTHIARAAVCGFDDRKSTVSENSTGFG